MANFNLPPGVSVLDEHINPSDDTTYRVMVNTWGDPADHYCGNAKRYDSAADAIDAATDLFRRWTAVKYWRVETIAGDIIESGP